MERREQWGQIQQVLCFSKLEETCASPAIEVAGGEYELYAEGWKHVVFQLQFGSGRWELCTIVFTYIVLVFNQVVLPSVWGSSCSIVVQ